MGDQMFLSRALKYYKRPEVQEAIARHARDREVSPRYGNGFGKRPDTISYPRDVLEFAKRKTTSFHCSEERWENPLSIRTGMGRKEADGLRTGWDLVLDIDTKDWELARMTCRLFMQALKAHGLGSIGVKFSGNKGWHIGVPWEAFPETLVGSDGKELRLSDLFPEMPRAIARYLIEYIGNARNGLVAINDDEITMGGETFSLIQLAERTGKEKQKLLISHCPACNREVQREEEFYALMCSSCGHRPQTRYTHEEKDDLADDARICVKCGKWLEFHLVSKKSCPHDTSGYEQRFKIDEVVEIDTILLASRHLYRMPYSLHEKSGLASVVIDPEAVLSFEKEDAEPETADLSRTFLDPGSAQKNEAAALSRAAWDAWSSRNSMRQERHKEFEDLEEAVPEEIFPPCMRNILAGIEDGKKRAMFALTNFLVVCGWSHDMIEKRLHEWNEQNPEKLREVLIKGHLKQLKRKKERIPPPNCKQFYQEMGVCTPDSTCRTIRNPAQYAHKLVKIGEKVKKNEKT